MASSFEARNGSDKPPPEARNGSDKPPPEARDDSDKSPPEARDGSGKAAPGRPPRPSKRRNPVSDQLPEAVRLLLLGLERLAEGRFSFPRMVTLIHREGGERLNPANITRWRNGTEFPTEDAVRRWTRVCGGDVDAVIQQYVLAKDAYDAWKADGRPSPATPAVLAGPIDTAASAIPDAGQVPGGTPASPDAGQVPGGTPAIPDDAASAIFSGRGPAVWIAAAVALAVVVSVGAGVLLWPRPDRGITVGSCTWPVRAVPAPDRVTPAGAFVYKLPSGDGSRDVPILAGGAVLQPFVASAPRIGAVASIIGLDGNRTDVTRDHPVRFEIIAVRPSKPATVIARQETAVTPANVNRDVVATFDSPVAVETGEVYVLRVVNLSTSAVIGFYVNGRAGPDRSVPYAEDVCLENAEGPFTTAGWSMSGLVAAAA
ncbi:hypothetical protein [Actinoplanes solisilvae]|uniref:hypothetical protein n=1 Tax=Actinoplanes solisilvae TaxID=2486853 RepID=UPI000FD7473D|nr:hypothetical protein [Actinoplanes solisilvae]